jgi:myosin-1
LESLGITSSGNKPAFSPGATKIFVRAPETIFSLEELRERKTYTHACRIQRFFLKHALEAFTYKLKKTSNDELRGKKDRRRLSLNRTFFGDYINYKENFTLKAIVGKEVKVHFADMVNKVDRNGKKKRLIFVVSEFDLCIIRLDKNKDKNTRKTNPFAYTMFRRITYPNLQSITFSTLADNFFDLKVLNEPDSLLENRKKKKQKLLLHLKKYLLTPRFNSLTIFRLI